MNSKWFQVARKETGVIYFACISRSTSHSDDSYSRWTTPTEYQVVPAVYNGYVLEPADSAGFRLQAGDFWNRYESVR
jgi:hypothetical protein